MSVAGAVGAIEEAGQAVVAALHDVLRDAGRSKRGRRAMSGMVDAVDLPGDWYSSEAHVGFARKHVGSEPDSVIATPLPRYHPLFVFRTSKTDLVHSPASLEADNALVRFFKRSCL